MRNKHKSLLGAVVIFVFGCGTNPYDRNVDQNVVSYAVNYDAHTPEGIPVDTSGQQVSMQEIDTRIDNVITCLTQKYPKGLPSDVMEKSSCLYSNILIDRTQLGVKVAPDWHETPAQCDTIGWGTMQAFPCSVDPQLCRDKGLTPSDECPCECRSAVLNNSIVVTTPNLHLFDDSLIRILTSCNNIWTTDLAECFTG